MATLQKFKLLAMRCGVAQSPTRSPTTSPLVQLRRRKSTLRMLLSRSTSRRSSRRRDRPLQLKYLLDLPQEEEAEREKEKEKEKGKDLMLRSSLKELFVSSPPKEELSQISEEIPTREFDSDENVAIGGPVTWRDGPGSPKPVWTRFRLRLLLRKTWRPGLVTIPE